MASASTKWKLTAPARKVAELLWLAGEQKLPVELMRLTEETATIIVDVDGVDYALTMTELPKQHQRPTEM